MKPEDLHRLEDELVDQTAEHFGREDVSGSYLRLARAIIHTMLNLEFHADRVDIGPTDAPT